MVEGPLVPEDPHAELRAASEGAAEWIRRPAFGKEVGWAGEAMARFHALADPSTVVALLDRLRAAEATIQALLDELEEVAASGVAFTDPRIKYVEIQIDVATWRGLPAIIGAARSVYPKADQP